MDKPDARKLSTDAQQQLRNQAVRLRKAGKSYEEIAEIVGVHNTTVCRWWKRYEREGRAGIVIQRRGRRTGDKRTLDDAQEREIQRLIMDKSPDQLKLGFALWTRRAVQQLIAQRYAVKMPIRTIGDYLKRWGFTPQKPLKRAYEQSPTAVQRWLDEDYPAIAARARQDKAEIHWGDETGLRSDSQYGRSYAPRGKTPAVRLSARRASTHMISSITNQGKVRFMVYRKAMDAQIMVGFMRRLIKDAGCKVYLILDNLRVHHSKKVKAWLAKHQDEIEVFYLPSYSPELNPDEYLNGELKSKVHSGAPARDKAQLEKKVISHMRSLQKRPKHVSKYFRHPKVAYAA